MSTKKMLVLFGVLVISAVLFTACAGAAGEPGPQGPAGPAGPAGPQGEPGMSASATDLSCGECHDAAGLVSAKRAAWELNKHGNGGAMVEEYNRNSCAFCHSGNTFSEAIAAGQNFSQVENGATEPARQDCRTCHQVHETYTTEDWALETTDPVDLVVSGANFDGGTGNLCVNCHQARRYMANFAAKDAAGAVIPDTYQANVRFNTHLSDQGDIMLGVLDVNDILGVTGKPGAHYSMIEDTCVGCHLGENNNHLFEAQAANCVACHADATSIDINGAVTAFEEKFQELHDKLIAKGILNADGAAITKNADDSPVLYDPQTAAAVFVYGALEEDASMGVHNPNYANALLDAALAALGE